MDLIRVAEKQPYLTAIFTPQWKYRSNMSTVVESMNATVWTSNVTCLFFRRSTVCRTASGYTAALPRDLHGADAMQVYRSTLIGGDVLLLLPNPGPHARRLECASCDGGYTLCRYHYITM